MGEIRPPVPPDVGRYAALLTEQLRQSGLPRERVSLVVHDVIDHVRATGEDPAEVFGQPADYAARWAPPPTGLRLLGRFALTCLGAAGLGAAVPALFPGSRGGSVPLSAQDLTYVLYFVLLLGVLPWTVDLWTTRRAARTYGHRPRVPAWLVRTGAVVAVAGAYVWLVPDAASGPDGVVDLPRWLLLLAGALGLVLVLRTRQPEPQRGVAPPPDRPGWWARLRRFLVDPDPRRGA